MVVENQGPVSAKRFGLKVADIPVHLMAKSQKPSVSQPAKDAEKNKPSKC